MSSPTTFGEDEKPEVPSQSLTDRIFGLSHQMRDLTAQLLQKEEEVATLKQLLVAIQGGYQVDGALPSALKEAGVKEMVLDDGSTIALKEEMRPPSMAQDSADREKVIAWMEQNGQAGVVKSAFTVLITKDKEALEKVAQLKALTEALELHGDLYSTIHPATLKKTIEELLEHGQEVPLEDLNVQQFTRATFKEPKKSRKTF